MAKDETFHGWKITHGEDVEGHPQIEMSKPGFVTMGERGEFGIDPAVMLQRLKPRILQQEVDAATTEDDRKLWAERQFGAIMERNSAREVRVTLAAQAEKAAQLRAEMGLDEENASG